MNNAVIINKSNPERCDRNGHTQSFDTPANVLTATTKNGNND